MKIGRHQIRPEEASTEIQEEEGVSTVSLGCGCACVWAMGVLQPGEGSSSLTGSPNQDLVAGRHRSWLDLGTSASRDLGSPFLPSTPQRSVWGLRILGATDGIPLRRSSLFSSDAPRPSFPCFGVRAVSVNSGRLQGGRRTFREDLRGQIQLPGGPEWVVIGGFNGGASSSGSAETPLLQEVPGPRSWAG